MKDQVTIFENVQFGQIRTSVTESGEPLFCLADVCKAIGLTQPSRVKAALSTPYLTTIKVRVVTGKKSDGTDALQTIGMTFISEPNLYKCIFQSRKKEAEAFQDWVCGEVLPSIRKNGGYMVAKKEETPEQIMAKALKVAEEAINRQKTALKQAKSENRKLQSDNKALTEQTEGQRLQIGFLKPGARFAKAVETSTHSILIGELARIIKQNGVEIGQNRLFQWLRDNKYLCKKGAAYNQPTQKAMDKGLFEIKKTVIQKPNGESMVTTTTKVTGKGQIYFVNKLVYEAMAEQGCWPVKEGLNAQQRSLTEGVSKTTLMKSARTLAEETACLMNLIADVGKGETQLLMGDIKTIAKTISNHVGTLSSEACAIINHSCL